MKTIAVSIDEPTIARAARLAAVRSAKPSGGSKARSTTLSAIVREALREHLDRQEQGEREERDKAIFASSRVKLERQARALVAGQTKR